MSESSSSWFSSLASCCGMREKRPASRASSAGRNIVVLRDQPVVISQPSAEPIWSSERTYEKTLERERERERQRARLRRTTSRDSSSVRKRWFSASSSPASVRRFEISGPTNFRHLQSESFQFPPPPSRPRPRSFRPIELSIYQPDNRLSAILPYIECNVTPPPRAYTANSSRWDSSSGTTLNHERSYSTMSFHVPRKHARQGSGLSDASMSPPRIPPKSRARAYTAPSTDRIVERIASALIEKDRLQAEINSVIERQSIYVSSRPSTAYDMRDFEPMPSIPAMPAAAPSFAERLSVDGRPHTAPSHMAGMHAANPAQEMPTDLTTTSPQPPYPAAIRYESISGSTTMHSSPEQHQQEHLDRPLAPPLPLVLRPPLRKKKSFSRVSHWLFHPDDFDAAHHHGMSGMTMMGMATTSPRPVKESDGFYQCVAPPEGLPRTSMETSSSVYTWETRGKEHNEDVMREGSDEDGSDDQEYDDDDDDDDDDEAKTVPTTTAAWTSSPEQTPKVGSSRHTTPVIGFGLGMGGRGLVSEYEKETGVEVAGLGVPSAELDGHRPLSVGVAF